MRTRARLRFRLAAALRAGAQLAEGPIPWEADLILEGVPTGDGRYIQPGALTWRDLPLPLMAQPTSGHGSMDTGAAWLAGRIETLTRSGAIIQATGVFLDDDTQDGWRARDLAQQIADQFITGISADLDLTETLYAEDQDVLVLLSGRIMGATVVPFPAFAESHIAIAPAGIVPQPDLNLPPVGADGPQALEELAARAATLAGAPAPAQRPSDPPAAPPSPSDAPTPRQQDQGVTCASCGRPQDMGTTQCPDCGADMSQSCPGCDAAGPAGANFCPACGASYPDPVQASAAIDPNRDLRRDPPESWFCDPQLPGPMYGFFTGPDGRLCGHLALWETRHNADPHGPGVAVYAPRSRTNYAYFNRSPRRGTGTITMGSHAEVRAGVTLAQATAHYERACAPVAEVRCGEDAFGIWFSGRILPDVDSDTIDRLLCLEPSGDWRPTADGLELIACLAVAKGGFSAPRSEFELVASGARFDGPLAYYDDGDRCLALIAAGRARPPRPSEAIAALAARLDRLEVAFRAMGPLAAEHLARRLGRG